MEIKELCAADLCDLISLYAHLHASDEPLPAQEVVEATWQEIQTNKDLRYFGVYIECRLVSSCTLSIIPNLTRGCRPYAVVENVVTHSDFRRQGYARAVLRHALQSAWDANCYKVMLMTGSKNEGTYRFYESVGFDRYAKQAFLAKPPKVISRARTGRGGAEGQP